MNTTPLQIKNSEIASGLTDIHGRLIRLGDPVRFLRDGKPALGTIEDCTQPGEEPYIGIEHTQGTSFMRHRPEHYVKEWGVEVLDCSPMPQPGSHDFDGAEAYEMHLLHGRPRTA